MTLDLSQFKPVRYLLQITESKCQNCGHLHVSSDLFLIAEPLSKYARSSRRVPIRRSPLTYLNLPCGRSVIRSKQPYCHDCFVDRGGKAIKGVNKLEVLNLSPRAREIRRAQAAAEADRPNIPDSITDL